MTYKESYMLATSMEELKQKVFKDTKIAIILGNNPDRLKAIEDAMDETVKEKGWGGEADD